MMGGGGSNMEIGTLDIAVSRRSGRVAGGAAS